MICQRMCFGSSRLFDTDLGGLGDIGDLGGDEDSRLADAGKGALAKNDKIGSIGTETPTEML